MCGDESPTPDPSAQDHASLEDTPTDSVVYAPAGFRGSLGLTPAAYEIVGEPDPCPERGCSLDLLNGSWLLQLEYPFANVRGPMRIEAGQHVLRLSGDMYREFQDHSRKPGGGFGGTLPGVTSDPTRPWYPSFPQNEYVWYFRSGGASYFNGRLHAYVSRYPWQAATQDFGPEEQGTLKVRCESRAIVKTLPGGHKVSLLEPFVTLRGCIEFGDTVIPVSATRTSPLYRGCTMEVDVMLNRSWPATGNSCDNPPIAHSVRSIFVSAGMDLSVSINQQNLAVDTSMTIAEMFNYMTGNANPLLGSDVWYLWMMIGSAWQGNPTILGLMFDFNPANPPHRLGAIGLFDPTLNAPPALQAGVDGQSVGNVPLAFIRTIAHEAGHAFNLVHPNQEATHVVPERETVMNQTRVVRGQQPTSTPYPCNADMYFADHNILSLIHSPDPQVKPGWLPWAWGHGNTNAGLPTPADSAVGGEPRRLDDELELELQLPGLWILGEVPIVRLTLRNTGAEPRRVVSALELAGGALEIDIHGPDGSIVQARSIALACGQHPTVELAPGEAITRSIQLFYGADGLRFAQPGRYLVTARLRVAEGTEVFVQSDTEPCIVASPSSDAERRLAQLTLDDDFGLRVSLADVGTDAAMQRRFEQVAAEHVESTAGAVAGIVLANSFGGRLRDLRKGEIIRRKATRTARPAFDRVLEQHGIDRTAEVAVAVAGIDGVEAAAVEMCRMRSEDVRAKDADDGSAAAAVLIEDLRRSTHGDYAGKSD